jgi:DNA-binding NarL/FixJ family response regulator
LLEYAARKTFMELIHRVLVVDDYEPWRRHVRSVLQSTIKWRIVGEAADGPEAIHKADTLKPDLILLDVGLPTLSGIKVAERILASNPAHRILFVSEHRSLAEGALATGALGYIIKSDAAVELLPAMEAVSKGRRYVGASAVAPSETHKEHVHQHKAGFYVDEAAMLSAWTESARTALAAGHTVIVVAIDSRRGEMQDRLKTGGIDLDGAIREKRYVTLDPSMVLSGFMINDWPDELLFQKAVTPIVIDALKASTARYPRALLCGECAPTLVREGKEDAAVRVEQLWDKLAQAYEVDTHCAYLLDSPSRAHQESVFRRINAIHTEVFSTSSSR